MAKLWDSLLKKNRKWLPAAFKPTHTTAILHSILHIKYTARNIWLHKKPRSKTDAVFAKIFILICLHENKNGQTNAICYCSFSTRAGPLSKDMSIPLTKECLNCIICQAGRLAKAYSPALCLCLRLNRAAAFENVTHSCRAVLPSEHTCIFLDQVCLSLQPAAGWSTWPALLWRSCSAHWQLRRIRWTQTDRNQSIQRSLFERLMAAARRSAHATGLVASCCASRIWQSSQAANKMGLNICPGESSG